MIDQLSLLSESAQNAKLVKNAYLDMERINEKVDQRKYLDAAALLQKLDNLICLDTRSPDDPVMRKSLASIGKELNTARWCDRSTLLAEYWPCLIDLLFKTHTYICNSSGMPYISHLARTGTVMSISSSRTKAKKQMWWH